MKDVSSEVSTPIFKESKEIIPLIQELIKEGFEICEPFSISTYNSAGVSVNRGLLFPSREIFNTPLEKQSKNHDENYLGLLVGNTKSIWSVFEKCLKEDSKIIESSHPLDTWIESRIKTACEKILCKNGKQQIRYEIRWVRDSRSGYKFMAQGLADVIGLAPIEPSMQLCVHPRYGPWFAMRAVILLNITSTLNLKANSISFEKSSCEKMGCATVQKEMMKEASERPYDWKKWLAVRDNCKVGAQFRYSPKQIEYHYTQSRQILLDLVNKR